MIQKARDFYREYARDFIAEYWVVLLAVAIAIALGVRYVNPAPPNKLEISTGADEGAFSLYAERYKKVLARDGVELILRPSAGAAQNLARLLDDESGINAGFLQGGQISDGSAPELADKLVSLGSMYYEPLWIFVRAGPAPFVPAAGPGSPGRRADSANSRARPAAATSAAADSTTPAKLSSLKGKVVGVAVPPQYTSL